MTTQIYQAIHRKVKTINISSVNSLAAHTLFSLSLNVVLSGELRLLRMGVFKMSEGPENPTINEFYQKPVCNYKVNREQMSSAFILFNYPWHPPRLQ